MSAHASHQSEALQHSNWHAGGRVSELVRGAVPRVDVRVSEIATASVRDRGTPYQFGGYLVGTCAVMYPCRMARCHQNALVILSPDATVRSFPVAFR